MTPPGNGSGAARVEAPFGRRALKVVDVHRSGGYRVFSLLDGDGPEPSAGQFYMLATCERWAEREERPYLPRAFSVADAVCEDDGLRLDFLVDDVGPGTARLAGLAPGERVWVNGPLGNPFSPPSELAPGAAGAILIGGGIGIAPMAILRRQLADRGVATRVLLGFRDRKHSGGLEDLFACCEVRLASEDGHAGHKGYVTDLLAVLLEGDDAVSAAVYACGPPAMLEAVRLMCSERGAPCELAMESPMACGFGACFGCAVPLTEGRLHAPLRGRASGRRDGNRDRPGGRVGALNGRSGDQLLRDRARAPRNQRVRHIRRDRRPARFRRAAAGRVSLRGLRLEDDHSAAPGWQPAATPLGGPGRDDQLDRASEQGPRRLSRARPAAASRACRCR